MQPTCGTCRFALAADAISDAFGICFCQLADDMSEADTPRRKDDTCDMQWRRLLVEKDPTQPVGQYPGQEG